MQNGSTYIYVGIFNGSTYDVGYAYGQLFGEEMAGVYNDMWGWMINWVKTSTILPSWLQWVKLLPESAIEGVMEMILESEYFATYYYTNPTWEDEFNGMADGSGIANNRI